MNMVAAWVALSGEILSGKPLPRAVFWDMDGTLIDSEPYWHEAELSIAASHGGHWTHELAWQYSGTSVPQVAQRMVELGTRWDVESIGKAMIADVQRREMEHIPWISGALELLAALGEAGVPSVLVTSSPRALAQHIIDEAPQHAFAGFVSGGDDVAKKPDPAPYRLAASIVGVDADDALAMARCVAFEDSVPGLQSAIASGATTVAQVGYVRPTPSQQALVADIPTVNGYRELAGYGALTPAALGELVAARVARLRR